MLDNSNANIPVQIVQTNRDLTIIAVLCSRLSLRDLNAVQCKARVLDRFSQSVARRNVCLIHVDINTASVHVYANFLYAAYFQQLLIKFRRSERARQTTDVQDDSIGGEFRRLVDPG